MVALVDTNVLVYRFDPRFPEKQSRAGELLREGIERDTSGWPTRRSSSLSPQRHEPNEGVSRSYRLKTPVAKQKIFSINSSSFIQTSRC